MGNCISIALKHIYFLHHSRWNLSNEKHTKMFWLVARVVARVFLLGAKAVARVRNHVKLNSNCTLAIYCLKLVVFNFASWSSGAGSLLHYSGCMLLLLGAFCFQLLPPAYPLFPGGQELAASA